MKDTARFPDKQSALHAPAPALLCALLLVAPSGAAGGDAARRGGAPIPRVLIAWNGGAAGADSVDQSALEEIFAVTGLRPERLEPGAAEGVSPSAGTLLVVPHASAAHLGARDAGRIVRLVERGCTLVTDGPGPLASALGVRTGSPVQIGSVTDMLQSHLAIRWRPGEYGRLITGAAGTCTPVFEEAGTHRPVAVILRRGMGDCLYVAPLVDPVSTAGYTRFPSLPWTICTGLGVHPPLVRRGAEAYFDPGYRFGAPAESLAHMWRSWGIRAIHAAAWYASSSPPFDYRRLLAALHAEGILAYAWLEWPYVGRGFWESHPSWRQKNALLADAHLDFLYLMDLQNPACMAGALEELASLLRLGWDGVDVAEFTLTGAGREALEGPAVPGDFTGFTDVGRQGFARQSGFDPLELFEPSSPHYWKTDTAGLRAFYRYRTAVNVATERTLFTRLRATGEGAGELMLTIVDNALHPEFDDLLGFSMAETVSLVREFNLTLMVEDPYPEWSKPPLRYRGVRSYYRSLLADRAFLIDVNIVPMPEDRRGLFATEQPTGTEFLQLWRYASGGGDRVCFYSESSVHARDWRILPAAMAAGARASMTRDGICVDAPHTVMLRGDGTPVLMDGVEWRARSDSEIIVPAGRHSLSLKPGEEKDREGLRLTTISGELAGAHASGDTLTIEYISATRCALGFSALPRAFLLDGAAISPPLFARGEECQAYFPAGEHRCTVLAPRGGITPRISPPRGGDGGGGRP
ncbi:MAG TPA: hypothetical protein VL221_04585 [Bacteroidota bacterium]|nr:hypothetical protein [Bacteroidota bacterium]